MATAPADRTPARTWPGAVGALLVPVAFGLLGGPLGVAAGLAVAGAWYRLSVPAAVAVGHLLALVVFPDGPSLREIALVEAGFLAMLLAPAPGSDEPLRFVAALLVAAAALLAAAAAGLRWAGSLPVAALLLVGVGSLLAYALHRYELVRLGLVEGDA